MTFKLVTCLCLLAIVETKIFNKCEMANILVKNRIPRRDVANWICLVRHESNFNSRIRSKMNKNKTFDHGIFQINDGYWCSPGRYNECKISCSALRDDNISDDIKCARKIYSRHGFRAWYGWRRNCSGKNLKSYTSGCKY
ncbi:lysozyme c-1-like [Centruroides sculpturatus]|uniref:lysozyme c-1-like n=1 Tax=Centruroides sculpturatus TaxID=218467 RepID=UPI000C6D8E0B|nr:lysozyme c-1-like [Centruroides sculpturatus]